VAFALSDDVAAGIVDLRFKLSPAQYEIGLIVQPLLVLQLLRRA